KWLSDNMPPTYQWTEPGPWNRDTERGWEDTATSEQMEALAQLVEKLRPCLDLIGAAAAKPHIQFLDGPRDASGLPKNDRFGALTNALEVLTGAALGARDPVLRLDAIAWSAAIAARFDAWDFVDHLKAPIIQLDAMRSLRHGIETGRLDA